MTEALFLSTEDIAGLATRREYVDAVREGFRQRGEGAPTEPKTNLWSTDPPGRLAYYGTVLSGLRVMGGLMHSSGFSAEDTWFVTPLFDAVSGEPLALVDGAAMNARKTGAAGAVGADALARRDATSVGIIGSGAQAREQLRGLAVVRDLETVRVYSPTRAHREAFAARMDDRLDASVVTVASGNDAVEGADIVVTATTSPTPVFDGDRLASGTHVTAMGQSRPDRREVDATTVARSRYVPDLRERALTEAGAFLHALERGVVEESHVHAELGEVVAGRASGRESDDQLTLFDSAGTAIETVAAAAMLYEKASERGLGTPIDLTPASAVLDGFGGT